MNENRLGQLGALWALVLLDLIFDVNIIGLALFITAVYIGYDCISRKDNNDKNK